MFGFATSATLSLRSRLPSCSVCSRSPSTIMMTGARMDGDGSAALRDALRAGTPLGAEEHASLLRMLESRHEELSGQINTISEKIATLRGEKDPSFFSMAVDSVAQVFSAPKDDYPNTGIPSGYTMDLPKKK